jgi:hypothetical protein
LNKNERLSETIPVLLFHSVVPGENVRVYATTPLPGLVKGHSLAELCAGEFFRRWPRFRQPGDYYVRVVLREDPKGKFILHHPQNVFNNHENFQLLDAAAIKIAYQWRPGDLLTGPTGFAYLKLVRAHEARALLPNLTAHLAKMDSAIQVSICIVLAQKPKKEETHAKHTDQETAPELRPVSPADPGL